jgi:hypothetical protein
MCKYNFSVARAFSVCLLGVNLCCAYFNNSCYALPKQIDIEENDGLLTFSVPLRLVGEEFFTDERADAAAAAAVNEGGAHVLYPDGDLSGVGYSSVNFVYHLPQNEEFDETFLDLIDKGCLQKGDAPDSQWIANVHNVLGCVCDCIHEMKDFQPGSILLTKNNDVDHAYGAPHLGDMISAVYFADSTMFASSWVQRLNVWAECIEKKTMIGPWSMFAIALTIRKVGLGVLTRYDNNPKGLKAFLLEHEDFSQSPKIERFLNACFNENSDEVKASLREFSIEDTTHLFRRAKR